MFADFFGEAVVERHMSRLGRESLYGRMAAASCTNDNKALDLVLKEYGESMHNVNLTISFVQYEASMHATKRMRGYSRPRSSPAVQSRTLW